MESLVIILAIAVGFLAGLIVLDLKQRKQIADENKAKSAELSYTLKALNETHNSIVLQVQQLQERMVATELRAQQGKTTQGWMSQLPNQQAK